MTSWRTSTAAMVTAFAFALGTIVVPVVHLAFHALPHHHDGGGIHYHDERHHQDHDGDDPDHGDRSAAHFSCALNDAPASSIDLALAGMTEQGRIAPRRHLVRASAPVSVLRFRGPPVVS